MRSRRATPRPPALPPRFGAQAQPCARHTLFSARTRPLNLPRPRLHPPGAHQGQVRVARVQGHHGLHRGPGRLDRLPGRQALLHLRCRRRHPAHPDLRQARLVVRTSHRLSTAPPLATPPPALASSFPPAHPHHTHRVSNHPHLTSPAHRLSFKSPAPQITLSSPPLQLSSPQLTRTSTHPHLAGTTCSTPPRPTRSAPRRSFRQRPPPWS